MDTLLDSGKYSDLRIVCRQESWNVHRNVISTASSVLERMNAHPGLIDLTEYEPKIVEKMLRFIYQEDYDDEHETVPLPDSIKHAPQKPGRPLPNGEALLVNIKVLIIAEKFGLDDLMDLAVEKHDGAAQELWDTPSFEKSITLLYDSKMDEVGSLAFRRATADAIANNAAALLERATFREVLNRYGDLATEVLSVVTTGKGWL
ncbi:hypothetical protein V500_07007 [Pseudogymnoascus sp. VKM F-4518 (FW-2643)]|nr:hypothetical protein V500_07007 [Pseudogymnoascus sp. VKM F-4518 (FW-2643)]